MSCVGSIYCTIKYIYNDNVESTKLNSVVVMNFALLHIKIAIIFFFTHSDKQIKAEGGGG